jgi:hypothetical protein
VPHNNAASPPHTHAHISRLSGVQEQIAGFWADLNPGNGDAMVSVLIQAQLVVCGAVI